MPLPTWNGEPVDQESTQEATDQASDVLREALGSALLTNRPVRELLHAVEAVAWLERLAEVGRHVLVPMAKANGASWADLGTAMGVSRATAQHRYKQKVESWEDAVREAAGWDGVEPLAPMDPPVDFHPSDEEFVRMAELGAWVYTGPLEPAIQYVRANHTEVLVHSIDAVHYVSSKYDITHSTTSADTEEDAWRAHLGNVLTRGDQPYPDDARPGETIADFKARTS